MKKRMRAIAFALVLIFTFTTLGNDVSMINVFAEESDNGEVEDIESEGDADEDDVDEDDADDADEDDADDADADDADENDVDDADDDSDADEGDETTTSNGSSESEPSNESPSTENGSTEDGSSEGKTTEEATTEGATTEEATTEEATTEEMTTEEIETVVISYEASEGGKVSNEKEEITLEDGAAAEGSKATAYKGYRFVNWTEDGEEVSTSATFVPEDLEDATYVAHFESIYTQKTLSATAGDGIRVTVTANENVFTEDAELIVETVTINASLEKELADTVADETGKEVVDTTTYAYDIKIFSDGEYFEPDNDTIKVSFSGINISEAGGDSAVVAYIDEDEQVAETYDASVSSNKVAFDAEHFSTYVITITADSKSEDITVDNKVTVKNLLKTFYNADEVKKQDGKTVSVTVSNGGNEYITISNKDGVNKEITPKKTGTVKITVTNFKYEKNDRWTSVGSKEFTLNIKAPDVKYTHFALVTKTTDDVTINSIQSVTANGGGYSNTNIPMGGRQNNGLGEYEFQSKSMKYQFTTDTTFTVNANVTYNVVKNGVTSSVTEDHTFIIKDEDGFYADCAKKYCVNHTGIDVKTTYGDIVSKWYKVVYNVDGDKTAYMDGTDYAEGEQVTVISDIPAKENCVFAGWEYNNKTYNAGDKVTMGTSQIEFVATWTSLKTSDYDDGTIKAEDNTSDESDEKSQGHINVKVYKDGELVTNNNDHDVYYVYRDNATIDLKVTLSGNDYTINKITAQQNAPDSKNNYVNATSALLDNVKDETTVYIYLTSIYRVAYTGEGVTITDNNLYTVPAENTSTDGTVYTVAGLNTVATIKDLPVDTNEFIYSGWTLNNDQHLIYEPGSAFHISNHKNLADSNKTFTFAATRTSNLYTVTVDPNGGYFPEIFGIVKSEEPYDITGIPYNTIVGNKERFKTPKKAGFNFVGWSTDKNATSGNPTLDQSLTVTENITVYAVWSEKAKVTVTVQYVKDTDHSAMIASTTLADMTPDSKVSIFADSDDIAGTGYTLKYSADETTAREWTVLDHSADNIVIYECVPKTDMTVEVRYCLNSTTGQSVAIGPDTRSPYTTGATASISADTSKIAPGYELDDEESKSITISGEVEKNVVIFICKETSYTVTFKADANGTLIKEGWLDIFDKNVSEIRLDNLSVSTETIVTPDTEGNTGYVFDKWVDEDGKEATIPGTGADMVAAYQTYPLLTYTAQFKAVEYKISYKIDAKFGTVDDQPYSIEDKLADPAKALSAPGKNTYNLYTFKGWFVSEDKDAQKLETVTSVIDYVQGKNENAPLRDITVYAQYEIADNARFFVRNDNVRKPESNITNYPSNEFSQVATGTVDVDEVFNQANKVTTGYDGSKLKNLFGISLDKGNTIEGVYTMDSSSENYDKLNKKLSEAGLQTFDPATQRITWYVIKTLNDEDYWHVDGVIENKVKLTITIPVTEVIYNGNVQSREITETETFEATDGTNTYKVTGVTGEASGENVGTYSGALTRTSAFKVVNAKGEDVTNSYTIDISGSFNLLKVNPAELTLTAGSQTFTYDGKPHDYPALADENGAVGLAKDQYVDLTFTADSTITTPGTQPNVIYSAKVYKDDTKQVETSDNYIMKPFIAGELKVEAGAKREITVSSASASKVYDGTALTNPHLLTTENLMPDDYVTATVNGTATDVADTKKGNNTIENIRIMHDIAGVPVDVTDSYDIQSNPGTLTITQRPITVTASSVTKDYDGILLTSDSFTYEDFNSEKETGLITGHEVTATVTGSILNTGSIPNVISDIVIKNGKTAVTDNYKVNPVNGTLTINDGEMNTIEVTAKSLTHEYDGTALSTSQNDYEVTGELHEGDRVVAVVEQKSITEVKESGTYTVTYKIMNGDTDVTSQYNTNSPVTGTMEITKRPMTITASSKEWEYDGEAHSLNQYETPKDKPLVEGQQIAAGTITTSGSVTFPSEGTVANTINVSNIQIMDGTNDVTANYDVKGVNGELKIKQSNKLPLTITAGSAGKIYDGTSFINHKYSIGTIAEGSEELTNSLVGSDRIDANDVMFSNDSTITDVTEGGVPNVISGVKVYNGTQEVTELYDINYVPGTLTVTPRPVTITATVNPISIKYGEQAPAYGYILSTGVNEGLINENDLGTIGYTRTPEVDAANTTVTVTPTYTANANYDVKVEAATYEIQSGDMTAEIMNYEGFYDAAAHGITVSPQFEDATVTYLQADGETWDATPVTYTNAGEYTVLVRVQKENYNTVEVSGTVTIKKIDATISVSDQSIVYGNEDTKNYPDTVSGTINGETLEYTIARADNGANVNVGDYPLMITLSETSTVNSNYNITTNSGEAYFHITQRPITLQAASASRVYNGSALTANRYTVTEGTVVNNSELGIVDTISTVTFNGSRTSVGRTPNVITSVVITGIDNISVTSNYEITVIDGILEILNAPDDDDDDDDDDGGTTTTTTTTIINEATPLAATPEGEVLGATRVLDDEETALADGASVLGAGRPQTGDETNIWAYLMALLASAGILTGWFAMRKKDDK